MWLNWFRTLPDAHLRQVFPVMSPEMRRSILGPNWYNSVHMIIQAQHVEPDEVYQSPHHENHCH